MDYYALLEISVTATAAEIKTAYRKAALAWHPDRHSATPETLDAATERFKQIQEAYEVLSDEQERGWYDAHKDEILAGGRGGAPDGTKPASAGLSAEDLMPYFSPACFSGFDGGKGFYAVYGRLFERIEEEEVAARAQRKAYKSQTGGNRDGSGSDESDLDDFGSGYPERTTFGSAGSGYPGTFYNKFLSFSTAKPFAWKDKYRVSDAPDRRIRRIMERENAKLRKKERAAYIDAVRSLVAYVRRRDPRYKAFVEEQEKERARKMEEERARIRQEKQEKLAKAARWQAPSWHTIERDAGDLSHDEVDDYSEDEEDDMEEDDEEFDEDGELELEGEEDGEAVAEAEPEPSSEEDLIPDDLYCPACEKRFANTASYANHEGSKKHRQNVERLRKEIEKEERELAKQAAKKPQAGFEAFREAEEDDDSDEPEPEVRRRRSGAPSPPTPATKMPIREPLNDIEAAVSDDSEGEDILFNLVKSNKAKKKAGRRKARTDYAGILASDDEQEPATLENLNLSSDDEPAQKIGGKAKKARRRKDKGAGAGSQAPAAPSEPAGDRDPDMDPGQGAQCLVCKSTFSSRSKLFAHVKATGHAVPLNVAQAAALMAAQEALAESGKKGKKGKRR